MEFSLNVFFYKISLIVQQPITENQEPQWFGVKFHLAPTFNQLCVLLLFIIGAGTLY